MTELIVTFVVVAAAAAPMIGAMVMVARMMDELRGLNPHARWLGRRVLVHKYDACPWELATVVAVSHKGALCIRRDTEEGSWWMKPSRVRERVREL